ncbi:hypothetical protein ACOSP7_023385 [Xanthoceras sorbifolium]
MRIRCRRKEKIEMKTGIQMASATTSEDSQSADACVARARLLRSMQHIYLHYLSFTISKRFTTTSDRHSRCSLATPINILPRF